MEATEPESGVTHVDTVEADVFEKEFAKHMRGQVLMIKRCLCIFCFERLVYGRRVMR